MLTTRDFGNFTGYGISVYAFDKNKMLNGEPNARAVQFFIDGNAPGNLALVGDGLLPADIDGKTKPKNSTRDPDRWHPGRRRRLRRHLRRDQCVRTQRSVERGADGVPRTEDTAAGRGVRLRLPLRADGARLPSAARHHGSGAVPRHPLLPAAADLSVCVAELQGLRGMVTASLSKPRPEWPACGGTSSGA